MSDMQGAEGNQGNTGFASEWQRLAREEGEGPGASSPNDADRLDDGTKGKAGNSGQANTPPDSEAAPKEPAPSENQDAIWANAPASLREAFEAERKAREKAENTIRSNNGRLSKAEREAAELRARVMAQPAKAEPAPAPTGDRDESDKRLMAVAEEYEDVAKPLVDEILALRETVSRLSQSQATAADQQRARDELELKEFLAGQEQTLSEAHSDWREIVVDKGFVDWVQAPSTPQFIRDGIARNGNGIVDGAESASILNLYKAAIGQEVSDPTSDRRQRQLEGSRSIPSRTPGATPQGGPDDFGSEWARLREQERRERQRTS